MYGWKKLSAAIALGLAVSSPAAPQGVELDGTGQPAGCGAAAVETVPAADAARAEDSTESTPSAGEPLEWSMSLRWENDLFGGTDRFYTNGAAISVAHSGPSYMDALADWLPWAEGRRTVGYDVVQVIATPERTNRRVPDPDDRPYAGVLTLGLALHVEREASYHGLKLSAGVAGPLSMAKETQDLIHDLVSSDPVRGWDYQLENEPVFNLYYEYRHRFELAGRRDGWALEALPIAGAALGNAITQGQIGALVRFGYNMPDDFGSTLARGMGHLPPPRRSEDPAAGSDWGFSIYGGGLGNLILRDITLDGNTFEDSPSVDKEMFVPMAGVGLTLGNKRFLASVMYVFWGKEFEGQDEYSEFGAITFTYFF